MNVGHVAEARDLVGRLLGAGSRVNEAKSIHYWYPLSLATYGAEEVLEALDSMCSFRTSMAEKTREFERRFATWQGTGSAVMVNSGSSADLLLSLLLTDPRSPMLPAGAEVIVPVVTWPTQIWSVMMAGMKVRFVDVDPVTLNVDLADLERAIRPETRAIFLVHLMGNPCNMDRVRAIASDRDLLILEDCCEAMGASWDGKKVGNFGIGSAFSFFFSHHITSMEGGMVVVPDETHAARLRLLRAHGWVRDVDANDYSLEEFPDIDPRYAFVDWGMNVRPTEVQAAFGLRQLERVDAFADRRAAMARRFNEYVATTDTLRTPVVEEKATPSWLALPVMIQAGAGFSRTELTSFLEDRGIETRPIVTGNVARHPVARLFPEFGARDYPGADEIHSRGFYIGLSPLQTDENLERVIECFDTFLKSH